MGSITLTQQQEFAIKKIKDWFFKSKEQKFVLSGYAGVGKSFLISFLVKEVLHLIPGIDAVFCAPTGKAAVVLMQRGIPAQTLHRLIYDVEEKEIDEEINGTHVKTKKLFFIKKANIGNYKLIILDEVSMVNNKMLSDLESFGIKMICVGDGMQLPPVAGNNNLIQHPDFILSEIVRQKSGNSIIDIATKARLGEKIEFGNYGNVIVKDKRNISKTELNILMNGADQVICGLNSTRKNLNQEIRTSKHFFSSIPENGEKLICTSNDWNKVVGNDEKTGTIFNLVNGMLGTCKNVISGPQNIISFDFKPEFLESYTKCYSDGNIFIHNEYKIERGQSIFVLNDKEFYIKERINKKNFKNKEDFERAVSIYVEKLKKSIKEDQITFFDFGWAISCHKSQGSEFNNVLLFDESDFFHEHNQWLYTGITRAKNNLVIIR